MNIIETEFQQCTIIMISHRLDPVLKFFDRVLVMDEGKVVETGDPRLLSLKPESHFARLLEAEKQKKSV
jgi:ABC-type multidrug transport system fused ATPase/permease subunit